MIEKIKKFLTVKNIIIIAIAIAVVVVGIIISIVLFSNQTNENKLKQELENIGRNYYENYYYVSAANSDELSDKAAYLSSFTSVGLKINLSNLLRYNSTLVDKNTTEFINNKTNEKCNLETSMVTIYPQEPFNKGDYQISTYLDCGFKSEE